MNLTPAERVQLVGLRLHQWLYERTDGRVGHNIGKLRSLLLRTKGARTGKERVAALVYVDDGPGRYVVVGSNGGNDKAPGWVFNARAEPNVEIQLGRERQPAVAYEAEGEEYERLWTLVNEKNRHKDVGRYDEYQTRTTRKIPLVVLTSGTGSSPP